MLLLAVSGLLVLSRVRPSAPPAEVLGGVASAGPPASTPHTVPSEQPAPYARLACQSPIETVPREIAFVHDDTLIGSGVECDVIIRHPSIARQHARVQLRKQGHVLCDLKSQTGTYVNDRRIVENLLKEGWIVRLGEVEFVFYAAKPQR